MPITNYRVSADGLQDLRRSLRKIDRDLDKGVSQHMRAIAGKVRADARSNAPRRSGALSRSIRYSVRQRGASIYSNLVYAPVHEFGGTISPRGTPIAIERANYMGGAVEKNTRFIETEMGELLDAVARRGGFT